VSSVTPGGGFYVAGTQARWQSLSSAFPSVNRAPDIGRDRAERQPRGLRVSVGRVTFPPCRARSRTHPCHTGAPDRGRAAHAGRRRDRGQWPRRRAGGPGSSRRCGRKSPGGPSPPGRPDCRRGRPPVQYSKLLACRGCRLRSTLIGRRAGIGGLHEVCQLASGFRLYPHHRRLRSGRRRVSWLACTVAARTIGYHAARFRPRLPPPTASSAPRPRLGNKTGWRAAGTT